MTTMRAKLYVVSVQEHNFGPDETKSSETLTMGGVPADKYDPEGLSEDNTFAKFSPSVSLQLQITNPALWGGFKPGDKFYADFTPAE